MTLYADILARLATATLVTLPGLLAALAITRWASLPALAKVWILRFALGSLLLALLGLGIPVAVGTGSDRDAASDARWLSLGIGLYAAGVLSRGYAFVRGLLAVHRLRLCTVPVGIETLRSARAVAIAMGLARTPPIRRAEFGDGVLLIAGRPATIVLPPGGMDEETLRLALAHEMAHIRHRDLLWSGPAALVECLFWFHPGVRLAARRLAASQETAADHAALAGMAAPTRRYAEMLINVATARHQVPLAGANAASVREDVEERLRSLYAPQAPPYALPLAVAALLITAVPIRPTTAATPRPADSARVFAPIAARL